MNKTTEQIQLDKLEHIIYVFQAIDSNGNYHEIAEDIENGGETIGGATEYPIEVVKRWTDELDTNNSYHDIDLKHLQYVEEFLRNI